MEIMQRMISPEMASPPLFACINDDEAVPLWEQTSGRSLSVLSSFFSPSFVLLGAAAASLSRAISYIQQSVARKCTFEMPDVLQSDSSVLRPGF